MEATRRIMRLDEDIRVVILTGYAEEPFPSRPSRPAPAVT